MAQTKNTPEPAEVPVEAAAEEKAPEQDAGKEKTIVTTVWAPEGPVPKASILQTAVQSVRDAIPVVFSLDSEITGAKKTTRDKQPGTEFEVTITYTPRAVAGKEDAVDVDKVIRGLDVPRSFDGIGGHDGDPDFHERKPREL
ncbi:hypothetical protein A5646_03565 [Mycobacterium sp. 1245499.0]|uniref:hypothetical protein n=1 Tax=Mycobacterium sp. 1245499.0 TaxID=1834074 RepID=UPI0007FBA045|nr:hypothetical protein [Mycobacterium sp. 1245499.0]OBK92392.1 hypothetical protein A5646_03565 [Mycobacterium sp. 1245499.0]